MTGEVERVVGVLEATPGQLEALLGGVSDTAAEARPGAEEWSAVEIVAHLRGSDDLLVSRLFHALIVDDVAFGEVSERRWAEVAGYQRLPLADLLRGFAARCAELVHALRGLDDADWQRAGQHATRGRQTVLSIATHLAEHELEHLEQLQAAVGSV